MSDFSRSPRVSTKTSVVRLQRNLDSVCIRERQVSGGHYGTQLYPRYGGRRTWTRLESLRDDWVSYIVFTVTSCRLLSGTPKVDRESCEWGLLRSTVRHSGRWDSGGTTSQVDIQVNSCQSRLEVEGVRTYVVEPVGRVNSEAY